MFITANSRPRSVGYDFRYGGRTTKTVSGKTDYLVLGEMLEDGRDGKQGSKYAKATEKKVTARQLDTLTACSRWLMFVRCLFSFGAG